MVFFIRNVFFNFREDIKLRVKRFNKIKIKVIKIIELVFYV